LWALGSRNGINVCIPKWQWNTLRTYRRLVNIFIERLAKEDFIVNIEYSKKLVRITCEGNALGNLIPFGQTLLTEFGG